MRDREREGQTDSDVGRQVRGRDTDEKKEKAHEFIKRMNSSHPCRKINDNSCINLIKSKNIKSASFSYACILIFIRFLLIKFLNTHRSFYSRKKIRQILKK